MRIWQIAKELGLTSKELCAELGAKSHMCSVAGEQLSLLKEKYGVAKATPASSFDTQSQTEELAQPTTVLGTNRKERSMPKRNTVKGQFAKSQVKAEEFASYRNARRNGKMVRKEQPIEVVDVVAVEKAWKQAKINQLPQRFPVLWDCFMNPKSEAQALWAQQELIRCGVAA